MAVLALHLGLSQMHKDDLIPLKRVLAHVGVGRVTLWRALNSEIEIPQPTIVRRRVFWRADEIQTLDHALDRYKGRLAFEEGRRRDRLLADIQSCAAAQKRRRKLRRKGRADWPQLELFAFEHQVRD